MEALSALVIMLLHTPWVEKPITKQRHKAKPPSWLLKTFKDCSFAEFLTVDEGLCVQIMHMGQFDDEPATVVIMDKYLNENGYINCCISGKN